MRDSSAKQVRRSIDSSHKNTADSLASYTAERLSMLCEGAGFGSATSQVASTFRKLVEPWALRPVNYETEWVSDVADDNTPIEFSVAIADKTVEVRSLFETQADEPTLSAYREVGLAFQERLEREFGASLERFRKVQDLFLPSNMQGDFAIWNAVVFSKDGAPQFKAYLNPQAQGLNASEELVKEGLARLGLKDVWQTLQSSVLKRGSRVDEMKYFALDLMPGAESRVKVYVRHHDVTANDLELAASGAETYQEGETREFVQAMCGEVSLLHQRAAFTCSSFIEGCKERPKATTVYVPVCAYVENDADVLERVSQYLESIGSDSSRYQAIVRSFANRSLRVGVGMQPWVAFRRYGGVRLSSYLATEAYHVFEPGSVPAPTQTDSAVRLTRSAPIHSNPLPDRD